MKNSRNLLLLLGVFVAGGLATFGVGWSTKLIAFPERTEAATAKTFPQMVEEALAQVPTIPATKAAQVIKSNPDTLVIDVRDMSNMVATGIIPGAVNISLGSLTYKADNKAPRMVRSDPGKSLATNHYHLL